MGNIPVSLEASYLKNHFPLRKIAFSTFRELLKSSFLFWTGKSWKDLFLVALNSFASHVRALWFSSPRWDKVGRAAFLEPEELILLWQQPSVQVWGVLGVTFPRLMLSRRAADSWRRSQGRQGVCVCVCLSVLSSGRRVYKTVYGCTSLPSF